MGRVLSMTDSGKPRVLVVDDEAPVRRLLRTALGPHGYQVIEAATAEEALVTAATARPDLILLDLGLPDADGTEVIRRIREWTQIPIIVLSVRGQEEDKVAALDAGADDYVTKPFSMGELLARMRVAQRHVVSSTDEPVFRTGDLEVDLAHRRVTVGEREVQLTPTEYAILRTLVRYAGRVLTHRQILREVWGPGYEGDTHLLRVNISNLRRKLEPDSTRPRYIITEPGVGYRLRVEQ
jgi:two-component system KDP operon response regulator KdpE